LVVLDRGRRASGGCGWPFASYTHFVMRGIPDQEKRRRQAAALYGFETDLREMNEPSEFVYDAEHDLYRFADGEFAFSREYANEPGMWEEGMIG
jgi:hypothetical protein